MRHGLTWRRPMSFYNAIVRLVTGGECDHSFTVVDGFVYEAIGKGVVRHSLKSFKEHHKIFKYRLLQGDYDEINLLLQVGKKYDFRDGIWFQLLFQASNEWCGDENEKDRWYCSELTAYAMGLDKYWIYSPKKLNQEKGIGEWKSM